MSCLYLVHGGLHVVEEVLPLKRLNKNMSGSEGEEAAHLKRSSGSTAERTSNSPIPEARQQSVYPEVVDVESVSSGGLRLSQSRPNSCQLNLPSSLRRTQHLRRSFEASLPAA